MESHCNYFVLRKKRMCRMSIKPGSIYCGEHQPKTNLEVNSETDGSLRMACPLDPKHTCFVSKLEKHLKVCNARKTELPSYIKKNCNVSDVNAANETTAQKRSLSNVPMNKLVEIIDVVEKIYTELVEGNISNIIESEPHPSVRLELDNEKRGNNTIRHLQQTSSLLNIIESQKLLTDNTCFVEFGAGKGHVSYYLASGVSKLSKSSVLLVDKASHRHKQDNKLDKNILAVNRIKADISDLILAEIPLVKDCNNIVGISKHLCGVATDLTLQCLTKPEIVKKVTGITMAMCCHHRCQWTPYPGKTFLEKYNIAQSEFDVICGLVSWATCGSGLRRLKQPQPKQPNKFKKMKFDSKHSDIDHGIERIDDKETSSESSDEGSDDLKNVSSVNNDVNGDDTSEVRDKNETISKRLGLSLSKRAELGFKAKAILDWGRVAFLKKQGFNADLFFYVNKDVSLENVCIVATKV